MSEEKGDASVSRPRESVEIGGRGAGKTFRMAERVKRELGRGATVFMANKTGGMDRVLDVDFCRDDLPEHERAAVERATVLLEERIQGAKEDFVTRSLMGAVTYTDVQALPAPKLEEIIATISEAMKGVGYRPPEFDAFRYEPRMAIEPEKKPVGWVDMYLTHYPFYVARHPSMFMNIDGFDDYRKRGPWTPPDRAERALQLLAARPLDRRRIKRCLRIMGLRR